MQRYNDTDVQLQEVELEFEEDSQNITPSDELKYPCIIIKGLSILEELNFFGAYNSKDSKSSLPLYVELEGVVKELGVFDLNVDFMLRLKLIGGDSYKIFLCTSENNRKELDYQDGKTLEKLIRL